MLASLPVCSPRHLDVVFAYRSRYHVVDKFFYDYIGFAVFVRSIGASIMLISERRPQCPDIVERNASTAT
jgi:hypothetical protein